MGRLKIATFSLVGIILVIALIFLVSGMSVATFVQQLFNALQWGSFYALIALGYSMVYGVLLLFNFTHGDIFMVGAYIGLGVLTVLMALVAWLGIPSIPNWLLLALTILLAMLLTSFVGMLVERIGYRPLRGAPRASAAITGLMIGIILETGNLALLGAQRQRFPVLFKTQSYHLGPVTVTNVKIMIVFLSLLLMLGLHLFVRRTKWGMAMRAMAYDFVVVPLMGVPLNTIAALTFALGSALAAAAGIFFGIAYPILEPYMGWGEEARSWERRWLDFCWGSSRSLWPPSFPLRCAM
jgi:branched-chain amino acid transport system permease protein